MKVAEEELADCYILVFVSIRQGCSTSSLAHIFVFLENLVGSGKRGHTRLVNLPHSLDIFSEIAEKCCIHRGIVDRYYVADFLRISQCYSHCGFGAPRTFQYGRSAVGMLSSLHGMADESGVL